MIFYTTVYGERHLPFLRVLLTSLAGSNPSALVYVEWDDIPDIEVDLLRQSFPHVSLVQKRIEWAQAADSNVRVSQKIRYWTTFLETVPEEESVCFLDVDTLVMAEIGDDILGDSDLIFTWKTERFPINTGVIVVRNSVSVRALFARWLSATLHILGSNATMEAALVTFGGADQRAFAELLATVDYTTPFERLYGSNRIRFKPVPCAELNETNSCPVRPQTKIIHLKSGWQRILLDDGDYTQWRTRDDCEDIENLWRNLDTVSRLSAWQQFNLQAARAHVKEFVQSVSAEHFARGILNSEMLAMIAVVRELGVEVIIESGRYLGKSTGMLAEALSNTGVVIHSTELVQDGIALAAESRLKGFDNLRLHYGDAAVKIPQLLSVERGKRIAILLDGPKGRDAFELLSDCIATSGDVAVGFVHDLRDSFPGMLNPNRLHIHEYFERIFFTDDPEYVGLSMRLDEPCVSDDGWKPYHLKRRRIGSYGPTLGVVCPTMRDRDRAARRLAAKRNAAHIDAPPTSAGGRQQRSGRLFKTNRTFRGSSNAAAVSAAPVPLRSQLHRVPGYVEITGHVKRWLDLRIAKTSVAKMVALPGQGNSQLGARQLAGEVQASAHDIIIDCGANVGDVVDKFVGTGAMIYAFEPNPYAFQRLSNRFRGNINVVAFPFAVLDRSAVVRLYLHRDSDRDEVKWSTGSSIFAHKANVDERRFVDVQAIDLSEFVFRLNKKVKLLKMDIEGAEYETLGKMIERGIIRQIDCVVVETHAKKVPELKDKHDALVRLIGERGLTNIDLGWV